MKYKITPDIQKALDLMERSGRHVFITGRAGTGKSTLLNVFREQTKKNLAVLAPTGVAAVNVRGQTIHSFFGFKPDITFQKVKRVTEKRELYERLETIIVDEVSMVRADLIDCMDKFLRLNGPERDLPFGGVQMIFIGDLYQLPPVVTTMERDVFQSQYNSPYFFSASVFDNSQGNFFGSDFELEFIELKEVFRQSDESFIELLNAVRDNTITKNHLEVLNTRLGKQEKKKKGEMEMYLTTTNAEAAAMNEQELRQLVGDEYTFSATTEGKVEKNAFPTDSKLVVKIGAQVMLLNNDADGRWINGTVGQVVDIFLDDDRKEFAVRVKLTTGEKIKIFPHKWDMYEFRFDEASQRIESEPIGSFKQYPFRLAWAVTIHKAQGKTFDKVILDMGRGAFSPGQLYVALSRCRTLEGITLIRPIVYRDIFVDKRVGKFLERFQK